jgi:hypothetical protein
VPVSDESEGDANAILRARSRSGWLHEHDFFLAICLFGVIAAALLPLARGLPARAFFVGDPGVKLIAARNAIEHPTRPFDIDVPRIGTQRVDFLDPFFRVHGDHAHAITSPLFPLISAPVIAAFGVRGAYVLPALGFLLAIAAMAGVGVALDQRRSWTLLLFVAAACTPLLFYALEFWEHAPAVGIAALATWLFVRRCSTVSCLACGLLLGVAIVLRPEAAWYGVALLFAAQWLPSGLTPQHAAVVIVGVAVICLPLATASAVHSGQVFGGHVTSNMSGITQGWWSSRMAILRIWFLPRNVAWLVGCALLSLTVAAVTRDAAARKFAGMVAGVFVAGVAVAAARRVFAPASLWNAAPAALLPFGIPALRVRDGQRFLFIVALVSSLLVALTAPTDGGGQWGPRYLLFAFVPLAILIADAFTAVIWSSRFAGALTVGIVLVSSLFVQRNAYKELQAAKRVYERIVDFVQRETSPGSYIVTDLWWLDQVTAVLYPTRVVLFVDGSDSARRALAMLTTAPSVFVVRSEIESPDGSFGQWRDSTPFVVKRQVHIPDRTLTILQLSNRR